jgi:predicted TIM-barrel fold metal-dependent hydrolase
MNALDLACDCHVHAIGPQARFPMTPDRHYTPGEASVAQLRQHLRQLQLGRAVIVQPSFYGTDHRCLLESLQALGDAARGVAVLDADVGDAELKALHQHGVRGIRINVESGGMKNPQASGAALRAWAERIGVLGWHVQIYATLDALMPLASTVETLQIPVVLDHFAMIPSATPQDDTRAHTVLDWVRAGHAYVKLSAPYRVCPSNATQQDIDRWAAALIAANPTRVLWGSDWPHTNREPGRAAHALSRFRDVPVADLARGIQTWCADPALYRQVMVENPARLYQF